MLSCYRWSTKLLFSDYRDSEVLLKREFEAWNVFVVADVIAIFKILKVGQIL